MHPFLTLICLPLAAGILGWLIGRLRNEFSFIGAVLSLYFAIRLFTRSRSGAEEFELLRMAGIPVAFRLDALAGFILLFVAIFGVLILLFSFRYMKHWSGTRGYYFYMMLALSGSYAVLLAANLFTLLFFWGLMLVVLYGLLLVGRKGAERSAGKALVVVGLGDFAMLFGIALLMTRGGMIDLVPRLPMPLTDGTMILAYVLVAVGALAKAGSMPLHSWIPEASRTSPATVMAYFPASLDKLLGIYLLTRLSVYVFDISSNMVLRNVLMGVGAVTVLGAVMMALVQKRVMRLLAFHAVSQVGYMVLGIGTGTPLGIAGGLFHMLNNSIYKSGLFLSAGTVEHLAKTDEIDKLGGLARHMPITFFSFLVCAMAIAGVPPLNGFVSKWMVYQGVIDIGREGNRLYPVFLVAAMLGSVLTLASFLKLLHAVFLGQRPDYLSRAREGSFVMWLPTLVLALLCIAFGVFAYQLPLQHLIYPSLPFAVRPIGVWQPVLTTLLVLIALGVGAVVYLLGTGRKPVEGRSFVGGEKIAYDEESRVTGTAFYSAVKQMPVIGEMLQFGESGSFDLYNWFRGIFGGLGAVFRNSIDLILDRSYHYLAELVRVTGLGLSYMMTGRLTFYLAMLLIGAGVFYLVLLMS
jgi:formate hydrogenlyase subunit 3/multisubunit Na+/H+ antiporter MnhD subunit